MLLLVWNQSPRAADSLGTYGVIQICFDCTT